MAHADARAGTDAGCPCDRLSPNAIVAPLRPTHLCAETLEIEIKSPRATNRKAPRCIFRRIDWLRPQGECGGGGQVQTTKRSDCKENNAVQ